MSSTERGRKPTSPEKLEKQIMSESVPKNEREWWAKQKIEELRLIIQKSKPLSKTHCAWVKYFEFQEDAWISDCDEIHYFTDGGPEQNGYKFCPYCGKPIIPEAT